MKPKICLSVAAMDGAFEKLVAGLTPYADVTVAGLNDYSLAGIDLFIGKKMTAESLISADRLKGVFAYKTGVDDFPLAALAEKGVFLVNSHVNSQIIAEYAFGLGVALTSRIAEYDRKMRAGDWAMDDPCWNNLFRMRAGLVGFGSIGKEIYKVLKKNGIRAVTLDRGKDYGEVETVPSLKELCKSTDILFLSLPKTAETDKLFTDEVFALMKGKYLVNVGRSNCIDEGALYRALKSGTLAGAAIDTWREKPQKGQIPFYPYEYPFHELENILLSSHKAMQVEDGHERYVADTLRDVLKYLRGEEIADFVDLKKGY